MRITTRGRYGLRAMIDVARHQGDGPVMMRQITERQRIPRKYLHSLLHQLQQGELIRSMRGSRGGYVLTRDPADITALMIIEALEGKISLVECRKNDPGACEMYHTCPTRELWASLADVIGRHLEGVSLAHLAGGTPMVRSKAEKGRL